MPRMTLDSVFTSPRFRVARDGDNAVINNMDAGGIGYTVRGADAREFWKEVEEGTDIETLCQEFFPTTFH